jgi:hypothetical protein
MQGGVMTIGFGIHPMTARVDRRSIRVANLSAVIKAGTSDCF